MSLPSRFGPNHAAVDAFLDELRGFDWYSRLGQAHPDDASLMRIDFGFIAARHEEPMYAPWGDELIQAEAEIERLVFEHRRLSEFQELGSEIFSGVYGRLPDDLLIGLEQRYAHLIDEIGFYPSEMFEPPLRLIVGATREVMLADLAPGLGFFRQTMAWFRAGHWPFGWEGGSPAGRIILW